MTRSSPIICPIISCTRQKIHGKDCSKTQFDLSECSEAGLGCQLADAFAHWSSLCQMATLGKSLMINAAVGNDSMQVAMIQSGGESRFCAQQTVFRGRTLVNPCQPLPSAPLCSGGPSSFSKWLCGVNSLSQTQRTHFAEGNVLTSDHLLATSFLPSVTSATTLIPARYVNSVCLTTQPTR